VRHLLKLNHVIFNEWWNMQTYVEDTSLYIVYAPRDPPWPYRALLTHDCYLVTEAPLRGTHFSHPLRRPWAEDADADHDKYLLFHPSRVLVWVDKGVGGYHQRLCGADETVESLRATSNATKIALEVLLYHRPSQQ
jgi:hypothetical protein